MGKTHSKPLAARHGRGTAWARHTMCESALKVPPIATKYLKAKEITAGYRLTRKKLFESQSISGRNPLILLQSVLNLSLQIISKPQPIWRWYQTANVANHSYCCCILLQV
jgi:hypothetical protein